MSLKWHVEVVPLGPFPKKCDLAKLTTVLNDIQKVYIFALEDPIVSLPAPTEVPEHRGNVTPQYDVDRLAEFVLEQRPLLDGVLRVCVVDHELYEDLFSTIDSNNRLVFVSIRCEDLSEILRRSDRSYEDYVGLETGAQLLTLQFRRKKGIKTAPDECGPPWHMDRRGCLFDYHGLDPQNVSKLMEPEISTQVRADLEAANIPQSVVDATTRIVKTASRSTVSRWLRAVWRDPVVTLVSGAWIGAVMGAVAASPAAFGVMSLVIVVVLGWRAAIVVRENRRYYGGRP